MIYWLDINASMKASQQKFFEGFFAAVSLPWLAWLRLLTQRKKITQFVFEIFFKNKTSRSNTAKQQLVLWTSSKIVIILLMTC
jgi:zona occludens toxin (predicted ATPase)